jgi:hypothetical protein
MSAGGDRFSPGIQSSARPGRARPVSYRPDRRVWVVLLIGAAVCAAAWAAFAPVHADSNEQVYVIPKGTWERRHAGEHLDVIPAEIRLTIGVKDVLVMRNQDEVPQLFGPVLIMPGQSFQLPFRRASTYLFACPLHTSGLLTIVVEDMPAPGWARLKWRATGMVVPGALR